MDQNKILEEIKQKVDDSKNKPVNSKSKPDFKSLFNKFKIPLIGVAVILIIIIIVLVSGPSSKSVAIYVTDEQGLSLKDAVVKINYNGQEETKNTDAFGYIEFQELKSRKLELTITKENYLRFESTINLNQKYIEQTIKLRLDPKKFEYPGQNSEKRREIIFKNYDVLINDVLNATFKCSTDLDVPQPKTATVTNGRQNVIQPKNCGQLLVSVVSNNYELITDREIPESNIVEMKKINSNTGTLEVTVKNSNGVAIPNTNLKVYAIDDPITTVNESEMAISTGTTDTYGKYKFKLAQSNYLISVDKIGYITLPKFGPYTVVNDNLANADLIIFTAEDLENINCTNPIYSAFCSNGSINCASPLLSGIVTPNPNGNGCIVGQLSNLTIKLKDQNTNQPVIGNISIYRRDGNISTLIGTRIDINQTTFVLIRNKNYRIVVSNTEDSGYISSNPQDINGLSDGNKTIEIPLEYSSALNSGTIKVNVKKDEYNRANALVYLFYELDGEYIAYNPESPRTTNLNGDVNFNLVRSNKEYYAYAILRNENADGDSLPSLELDNNEVLELNINLGNQARALNLKITPNQNDYNFSFFDITGEEISKENIIIANAPGDSNKTFVFNCENCSRIYLKIKKDDIIYQTDLITLFPGQTTNKEISFPTTLSSIQTTTEYLGLYDSTGTIKINKIGFIGNNDITKEYKLKFKTVFGSSNQDVLKKVFVKAGQYLTQNDDYIYLVNTNLFVPENTELNTGCRYSGTLNHWDNNYFNTNYSSDVSGNQCVSGKYKWTEFDFSDIEPNIIEYSINIKFKNEITNPDNYKIYYRSINSDLESFSFSPTVSNWQDWTIRPEGYFYASTTSQSIPFDSNNYSYNIKLYDNNGELEKFGSDYILYIDKDYNYSFDFIQFGETNRTGDIIVNTANTNEKYLFSKNSFKDKINNTVQIQLLDNNLSVIIPEKTTTRGYYFTNQAIGKPIDFFSLAAQPSIKTQLFRNAQNSILETTTTNILSYAQNDYVPEVKSQATDNKIYIGLNDLNISLKNKTGQFQNGISVRYIISGETVPTDIGEITNNYLNTQIFIADADSGKTITFIYTIPNSNLPNNELELSLNIGSGIDLYDTNNQLITNENKLKFPVIITELNGIKKISETNNNYIIKNKTGRSTILEDISTTAVNGLLTEEINQKLILNNQLPRTLIADTDILASALIDINTTDTNIDFEYNNLFTLQNQGNQEPTTIYRVASSNIKIKRIVLTDESMFITEDNGFYTDSNGSGLELITDISTNRTLEYYLDLSFDNSQNYQILEISTTGDDLTNIISFSQANTVISESNKVVGNINFIFTLIDNQINQITEKNINLQIKIGNPNESFNYEIPLKIIIYPKNKAYELTTQGSQINIPCKSISDCKLNKVYTFKNKTKSYNMSLSTIQMPNALPISMTFDLPTEISNTPVSITIDGNFTDLMQNAEGYKTYNKSLTFDLNLNNNTLQETRNLIVQVTYIPEDPETIISDNGFTGNFCLGVGGLISGNDQFILGSCNFKDTESCKSGPESIPKVLYNWGQESVNWNTLCMDTNLDYDFNKIHCDSVQALYSIFTLIGDSIRYKPQDNNYYVYLMYDGISEDLLSDYRESYNDFLTHNITQSFQDSYLKSNHSQSLEIIKTNQDGTPTKKVGKYKLTVENYNSNFTTDIVIKLQLIQSIPIDKDNLFYYIPVDGDFGLLEDEVTAHRIGYGSTIVGNYDYAELIPVIQRESGTIKLYKKANCPGQDCSGIAEISANYPTSYLIDWQVQDVLNSKGVLFDLSMNSTTEKIQLALNFTPSRPINIFAKVNNIQDNNFSYKIKYSESDSFDWDMTIFNWKDYMDAGYDNTIDDISIFGFGNEYLRHTITTDKFRNKYGYELTPKYLLESKIYLPVNSDYDNLRLSIQDLENNQLSKLYGKDYTSGETSLPIISNVSDIYSIFDMFNQVREGNACISKSLSTTKIQWIEEKTNLPIGTKELIINNFNNTE